MIAERILAKDKSNFMSAYAKETERPYGYLLIDNQPKTPAEKQVHLFFTAFVLTLRFLLAGGVLKSTLRLLAT